MDITRKYLLTIFYGFSLIFAIACYYFTISEGLFGWFFPDELMLSKTVLLGSIYACTKTYYFHTTVNRLSADFAACLMAKGSTLFTPYLGWVIGRLACYILMPVSIAFALKNITKIPFRYGLIPALIFSAGTILIIANYFSYMYGLDLAIYATASVSFFVLVALFPKITESRRYFIWFCVIYFINLTSHEVFLVISGFFVPLYAWQHYLKLSKLNEKSRFVPFVQWALKDKNVRILLAVYIIGALFTVLAPGVEARQNVWPTSGTTGQGILYIFLSIQGVAFFFSKYYILLLLTFLLGMIFRLFHIGTPLQKSKWFYVFIFSTPLVYLLLVAFLIGLTPTLWSPAVGNLHIFDAFLSKFITIPKSGGGGFYISRVLFFYLGLFFNLFLAGFLIAGYLKSGRAIQPIRKTALTTILFCIGLTLCVLHPSGTGSLRILKALMNRPIDLSHYSVSRNIKAHPEESILYHLSAAIPYTKTISNTVFPEFHANNHESSIVNLLVDQYLRAHHNKTVSPSVLTLIYEPSIPNAIAVKQKRWKDLMYFLFNVSPKETP